MFLNVYEFFSDKHIDKTTNLKYTFYNNTSI